MHNSHRFFLRFLVFLLISCLSLTVIPFQSAVLAEEQADDLSLMGPVAPAAKVLFTFDDGWKGQIDYAWPILDAAGFRATSYINSDSITGSQVQYMREADLDFLYNKGWDIGNHTSTHESTMAIDPASLELVTQEYLDNQNWIIDHVGARGAYHVAYPSGSFVSEYLPILRGIGALTARTTVQLNLVTPITNPDTYYLLPIKSLSSEPPVPPATETSVDRTKAAIDEAVLNGKTVIIMMHDVQPTYDTLVTTTADLQTIVDYVEVYSLAGSLQVQTISEWYADQIVASPLTSVTPPAPIVSRNDATDTVAGITSIMEYSLDSGSYVPYDGTTFWQVNLSGNHTLDVRYKAVGINEPGPATRLNFTLDPTEPIGRVIFSFDGGWKSQITNAFPIMDAAGFKGVAYVHSQAITVDPDDFYLDTAELATLYGNGWDISNKTTKFSSTGLLAEYLDNQNWILTNIGARGAYHVAYPDSIALDPILPEQITLLKSIGALTARTMSQDNIITPLTNPDDYYTLTNKSVSSKPPEPGYQSSFDRTLEAIDEAVASGKTIILTINKVESVYNSLVTTTADFQRLVDHVKYYTDRNKVDVVTMSEWYLEQAGVEAPANVSATVKTYNSVQVDWDAVDGAVGYEVERKLWSTGVYSVIGTPTTNSLLSTGLTPNKTYYFRVRAYRMNGSDKVYSPYSAVKTATPGPAAPTGVKATVATYNSVNVTWTAAAGASGYEVERKLWSTGAYSVIATTASTSITSSGLAVNKTYYFRVRAYKMVGETKVYSPYSAVVSATPGPAAPTGVKAASASYNSAKVTWTASTGAAGYEIERKLWSTGAYSIVGTTTGTSFTSTGLATNKTYYFRIRAYKMVGTTKVYSPYSAVVGVTPIPSAPTNVKTLVLSPTSAQVSWTAVAGASGYVVERKLLSTGTYTAVATTTATSITNSGLLTGKIYYYRVRAYRLVGTTRVYSLYSSVVSATPK